MLRNLSPGLGSLPGSVPWQVVTDGAFRSLSLFPITLTSIYLSAELLKWAFNELSNVEWRSQRCSEQIRDIQLWWASCVAFILGCLYLVSVSSLLQCVHAVKRWSGWISPGRETHARRMTLTQKAEEKNTDNGWNRMTWLHICDFELTADTECWNCFYDKVSREGKSNASTESEKTQTRRGQDLEKLAEPFMVNEWKLGHIVEHCFGITAH